MKLGGMVAKSREPGSIFISSCGLGGMLDEGTSGVSVCELVWAAGGGRCCELLQEGYDNILNSWNGASLVS